HPWILRSLPAAPTRVLDVGCGRGELVGALIPRAGLVEGIDPDAAMAYATATRFWSEPRVHIARRTLTEQAGDPARAGQYDAVTMVAPCTTWTRPPLWPRRVPCCGPADDC